MKYEYQYYTTVIETVLYFHICRFIAVNFRVPTPTTVEYTYV